jgi:hypothetical protein
MGTKIETQSLWAMKLAGDAIADGALRRRYLEKLAVAARRISAVAPEEPHPTRQGALSPLWDDDPLCVFDTVLTARQRAD